MVKEFMLSTIDNPYNPFEKFDEWLQFDISKGYNTLGYLARIAQVDSDMDDDTYIGETNRAIDEIIELNPTNFYVRVSPETDVKVINKIYKELLNKM